MIGRKNGIDRDIKVIRPIEGRPDLIVVQLKDGRRATFGDGSPLTTAEFLKVTGGTVESTTSKLEFTEDEQSELSAAADLRERSKVAVDRIFEEIEILKAEIKSQSEGDRWGHSSPDGSIVHGLNAELNSLKGPMDEAGKVEHAAIVDYNATHARIYSQARVRQFPPQFHKTKQSTERRLKDLESRND